MDLHTLIKAVMPSFSVVEKEVEAIRLKNPHKTTNDIARQYVAKARNKYASVGAVTALPGVIPGVGTVAQIAIEAGAISADVLLMFRWMASVCYGIAKLYGQDIKDNFEDEFTVVLGIWAGILVPEKAHAAKGDSISVNHFDKHISDRIRNRMNQKIGRKLVAKYGSKRGGVALGTLIPFGIGAAVGGSFNFITLNRFGKAAIAYFGTNQDFTEK